MKQEKLNQILNEHKLWLYGNGGKRANLRGANLRDANLRYANLRYANLRDADLQGANLQDADLRGANLRYANLRYANLRDADLQGAYLQGAYLQDANLRDADLRDADLRDADLRYANLQDANLRGADLRDADGAHINCPEVGSFVAFKKARSAMTTQPVVVKLQITDDAKRSSATGRKCRCNKAVVLEISDLSGVKTDFVTAISSHDCNFVYTVGETVSVDNFDDNRWNECAPGIHFFITRQEAVGY